MVCLQKVSQKLRMWSVLQRKFSHCFSISRKDEFVCNPEIWIKKGTNIFAGKMNH